MNIYIQWLTVTANPVAFIVIVNLKLSVGDIRFDAINYILTSFNDNTVDRILGQNNINILSGNNSVEVSNGTNLLDNSP